MEMPGRKLSTEKYRFSISGQEKSTEIATNTTSALFWEYDNRIMFRWNTDPRPSVNFSPYAVFGNNPIINLDPLGDSTIKPNQIPYANTVSSNGNWIRGALLLPGNTYVKAQNTVAGTLYEAAVLISKSSSNGLGQGVMAKIDEWGENLKDLFNGTKKYITNTTTSEKLNDAGQWISNPDNVYGAFSDAAIIYGAGRMQASTIKNWTMKGNVSEWGSLKGGSRDLNPIKGKTNCGIVTSLGCNAKGISRFSIKSRGNFVK